LFLLGSILILSIYTSKVALPIGVSAWNFKLVSHLDRALPRPPSASYLCSLNNVASNFGYRPMW
jgi:hypothetical protein